MALPVGIYRISTKEGNFLVGRRKIEDKSLNPKQVVLRPQHDDPMINLDWIIEPKGDGKYIMRISGSPTANIDGRVFAVLLEQPPPTLWTIEPRFYVGRNTYIITESDSESKGWAVPESGVVGDQIVVDRIIVGMSEPPTFRPINLFVINNAD